MKTSINVNWINGMAFESDINGHKMIIDAVEAVGGEDKGPRPKPLMLLSLAGCTGMDVVSMLKKMRVEYDTFRIEVEGELTENHPKYYHTILIKYFFKGNDLPMEKIEKAVNLSQDSYCGVTAMLSKAAKINYEIIVE